MKQNKRKFLIVVDNSYLTYFCIFGSTNEFEKRYPIVAAEWLKPVEECDQDNLPDLMCCAEYRKVLRQYVMNKLQALEGIAKTNFGDEIDSCEQIDIIFACDDKLKRNFRLDLYPSYKANRLIVKRSYRLDTIKDYIKNVLYKELKLEEDHGYKFITVEGAEGDDVIATVMKYFAKDYIGSILISSDRDFLQLDNVREFDLFGKEAERKLGGEIVSADDFLLGKILMGDKSDNISQVFLRCGPKTALSLVKNKDELKKKLVESSVANEKYQLNKKIIAFSETPKELTESIKKTINEVLYSEDILNPASDLKSFMIGF